jgi:hypothetical protein
MSNHGGGSDVFHAQGAYLFQDTCVNLKSKNNIAGDWISVHSGGLGGPGGAQLDKIYRGACGPLYVLSKALKARQVHTQSGAGAKWDGKVLSE